MNEYLYYTDSFSRWLFVYSVCNEHLIPSAISDILPMTLQFTPYRPAHLCRSTSATPHSSPDNLTSTPYRSARVYLHCCAPMYRIGCCWKPRYCTSPYHHGQPAVCSDLPYCRSIKAQSTLDEGDFSWTQTIICSARSGLFLLPLFVIISSYFLSYLLFSQFPLPQI